MPRTSIRDVFRIPVGIIDIQIPAYLRSRIKTPSDADIVKMNRRLKKVFLRIEERKRPDWNQLNLRFKSFKF